MIMINIMEGSVKRTEVLSCEPAAPFAVVEIGFDGGSATVFLNDPVDAKAFAEAFDAVADDLALALLRARLTATV